MKKLFIFGLAFALVFAAAGCSRAVQTNDVAGKTYVYEKDGFGGDFSITIDEDGSFQYYEGLLSSYIGVGTWQLDGDILSLTDDGEIGHDFINHFRVRGDTLVFQEENSSNFLYVKVVDGGQFCEMNENG